MPLIRKDLALQVLEANEIAILTGCPHPSSTANDIFKKMAESLDLDPEKAGWPDIAEALHLVSRASLKEIVDAFYARKPPCE